jgi:hypothetical protein
LLFGLDAFCCRVHAERASQVGDGLHHDGRQIVLGHQVPNKAAIQFDLAGPVRTGSKGGSQIDRT